MIKAYQIYFKEEQKNRCETEYIPYDNNDCNYFFESQVIKNLIESGAHKEEKYFAVLSYKLREKIAIAKNDWKSIPNIANHSVNSFSPKAFEIELRLKDPDILSYQRHQSHDPITFADKFHPYFSRYFAEIMAKIGYDWKPTRFENVFYCNYFAAKSEIYERFVKEMLAPAMSVMLEMPELTGNSKYPRELPEHLKQKWGIDHYPYHAFICERMMSYFAWLHNLKCLHY